MSAPTWTTKIAERTPVLPVTVHTVLVPIMLTFPPVVEVMVQLSVSVLKPVPETCIVVPGSAATGGEPDAGIGVTA